MSCKWEVDRTKLDPQLVEDVTNLFDEDPADWIVHYGFRSSADQERLWEQGRTTPGPIVTNAKPGHSPHEFGLAIDFHQLVDGKDSWNIGADWKRIMAAVDAHPRLHGGWHFPTPDNDHIQSVEWYKKRAELIAAGKW